MEAPGAFAVFLGFLAALVIIFLSMQQNILGFGKAQCDPEHDRDCVCWTPTGMLKPALIIIVVCLLVAWLAPYVWYTGRDLMQS